MDIYVPTNVSFWTYLVFFSGIFTFGINLFLSSFFLAQYLYDRTRPEYLYATLQSFVFAIWSMGDFIYLASVKSPEQSFMVNYFQYIALIGFPLFLFNFSIHFLKLEKLFYTRLIMTTITGLFLFFLIFVKNSFFIYSGFDYYRIIQNSVFQITIPDHKTGPANELFFVYVYSTIIGLLVLYYRAYKKTGRLYIFPVFVGFAILSSTGAHDMLSVSHIWIFKESVYFFNIGYLAFNISLATMLSMRSAEAFRQVETLSAELENKNKDLKRMDQLKDEFLANTSHELRTPLNGIMGLAEASLSDLKNESRQIKNLKMILSSGKRLSSLVNDILDFSKLKNADIQLHLRSLDVRIVAELVLELSRPLAERKGIELLMDFPELLPPVSADEDRLQQILINLTGNAIKFTNRGSVTIRGEVVQPNSENKKRRVLISIIDTGIGIPEEKQSRIFESFEQADGATAREYGGTGLGLSIVKSLVQLHGSDVIVESETGSGSKFSFTLPEAEFVSEDELKKNKESELTIAKIMDRQSGRNDSENGDDDGATVQNNEIFLNFKRRFKERPRILVVDDEPVNIQVLENHLETAGVEVHIATDGFRALEQVEQVVPDLILLDLMMPRMSGFEVCRNVRKSYAPEIMPVVILSAKNQVGDLVHALEAGANDYLTKPFSSRELMARLGTHLDLRNSVQEQIQQSRAFRRFVPEYFLKLLGKLKATEIAPGDSTLLNMSVIFTDIRSFTRISEKLSPAENFDFVNKIFNAMEPAIQQNNGFVDKYLGDAIMALFTEGEGDQTPDESSADRALSAALDMRRRLVQFNEKRIAEGREPIEMGIGINTGEMMLGTVGSQNRLDTTVIGNAVNTASRLETLTTLYECSILISVHTFKELRKYVDTPMREIGSIVVKGRTEPIGIYEVYALDDPEQQKLKEETRSNFLMGIVMLKAWEFAEAKAQFQKVLDRNPHDRVAKVYLDRCEDLFLHPPSDEWQGSIDMKEK